VPEPAYLQLAGILRDRINAGEWQSGATSAFRLATSFVINRLLLL
jgi:DNA-binding GntR family transcriptional regulator